MVPPDTPQVGEGLGPAVSVSGPRVQTGDFP